MSKRIAFISYRGKHYEEAKLVAKFLYKEGYCDGEVLFPPNSLCEPNELLMPYEYFELMGFIRDSLARCTHFYYLNTPDYRNSYFTQAEILQWRAYKKPVFYPVDNYYGKIVIRQAISLPEMSNNEKSLLANLAVSIDRSQISKYNQGFVGGKFNRNCFLFPCGSCGEHFLVSKKAVRKLVKEKVYISCPHCSNKSFHVYELSKKGNFYRKPLILDQNITSPLRVLETNEIYEMLNSNTNPVRIPVITLPGEKLSSDLGKIGKFYGVLGGLALGTLLLSSLFDWGKND